MQFPQPGLEPGPLNVESSSLTMRPPPLSSNNGPSVVSNISYPYIYSRYYPSFKQIHYQMILVIGKPAGNVICSEAKNENVDLIVTGARGLSTARRTILGSVSDYVVHHTHCPVCVVPPPADKHGC